MNKTLIYSLFFLILGLCLGIIITVFFYPFIFPPAQVNERITDIENKEIIASAMFIHPNPSDPIHWGKGGVSVYKGDGTNELFIKQDFEVGPGPDYHVYLSTHSSIKNNEDFESAKNFELGRLKSFAGSQVYNISNDIDLSEIHTVVVWCKAFGQLISSAQLSKPESL